MEKLIKQIKQWGIERGIDKQDILMQTTKTLEECIELQQAILAHISHENHCPNCEYGDNGQNCSLLDEGLNCTYKDDIKDAIGDIFVTIMMIDLQAYGVCDDMVFQFKDIEDDKSVTSFLISTHILEYIRRMQFIFSKGEGAYFICVERILYDLEVIANRYDFTLEECVEYAYNEIKDRKGTMVNGLFVKESE